MSTQQAVQWVKQNFEGKGDQPVLAGYGISPELEDLIGNLTIKKWEGLELTGKNYDGQVTKGGITGHDTSFFKNKGISLNESGMESAIVKLDSEMTDSDYTAFAKTVVAEKYYKGPGYSQLNSGLAPYVVDMAFHRGEAATLWALHNAAIQSDQGAGINKGLLTPNPVAGYDNPSIMQSGFTQAEYAKAKTFYKAGLKDPQVINQINAEFQKNPEAFINKFLDCRNIHYAKDVAYDSKVGRPGRRQEDGIQFDGDRERFMKGWTNRTESFRDATTENPSMQKVLAQAAGKSPEPLPSIKVVDTDGKEIPSTPKAPELLAQNGEVALGPQQPVTEKAATSPAETKAVASSSPATSQPKPEEYFSENNRKIAEQREQLKKSGMTDDQLNKMMGMFGGNEGMIMLMLAMCVLTVGSGKDSNQVFERMMNMFGGNSSEDIDHGSPSNSFTPRSNTRSLLGGKDISPENESTYVGASRTPKREAANLDALPVNTKIDTENYVIEAKLPNGGTKKIQILKDGQLVNLSNSDTALYINYISDKAAKTRAELAENAKKTGTPVDSGMTIDSAHFTTGKTPGTMIKGTNVSESLYSAFCADRGVEYCKEIGTNPHLVQEAPHIRELITRTAITGEKPSFSEYGMATRGKVANANAEKYAPGHHLTISNHLDGYGSKSGVLGIVNGNSGSRVYGNNILDEVSARGSIPAVRRELYEQSLGMQNQVSGPCVLFEHANVENPDDNAKVATGKTAIRQIDAMMGGVMKGQLEMGCKLYDAPAVVQAAKEMAQKGKKVSDNQMVTFYNPQPTIIAKTAAVAPLPEREKVKEEEKEKVALEAKPGQFKYEDISTELPEELVGTAKKPAATKGTERADATAVDKKMKTGEFNVEKVQKFLEDAGKGKPAPAATSVDPPRLVVGIDKSVSAGQSV